MVGATVEVATAAAVRVAATVEVAKVAEMAAARSHRPHSTGPHATRSSPSIPALECRPPAPPRDARLHASRAGT
eukprot:36094-Prymnesium_polylepis.1